MASSETALATEPVITVTPYQAADAHALTLTERAAEALHHVPDVDAAFRAYEAGTGWTLRVDGVIVGCAGLLPMWAGVANAWLLPSPLLPRYPKTVILAIVTHLRELIAAQHLRRIQCTVQADYVTGRRFIEWLGFEPESVMTAYGPNGEDHIGYAWVRPSC